MAKSPDAFRTISEVADWLGVEAHVLRFWETKFAQLKPVKRAGGRRYYRPSDMALLGGIRRLLHDEGMTIRGVQRILRENGIGHVAALSPELRLAEAEAGRAETLAAVRREAPPAPAPDHDDSPTLPFELPGETHAEPEVVLPLPRAETPAADAGPAVLSPPHRDGADAAADPALQERFRARVAHLDPAAAASVLSRARALVERLRTTPE